MSVLFPDNPGTSLGESEFANFSDIRAEELSSPDWMDTLFFNHSFIDSEAHLQIRGFCRNVLAYTLPWLGIRYWDLAIFIPNLLFFSFLLLNIRCVLRKLANSRSPVFKAFFVLVYLTTVMNLLRCVVSMTISATNPVGEIVDKALWISLKFFYMTAELSVLGFALLFGHLDSLTAIRRALAFTLIISLLHTAIQTVLELKLIDQSLIDQGFFDLHSSGGLFFWIVTAAGFALIYLFVPCLPFTCFRKYVSLPSKCSFYWYCFLLAMLNIMQAVGALLIYLKSPDGMCFVDLSTFLYFTLYTPIVYFTFLRKTLKHPASNPSGTLFSYRKQRDERGAEDHETYYPRFSGLTSPSYDDLFDCRDNRFAQYDYTREYMHYPFETPLMPAEPAESTVTTRTGAGSEDLDHNRDSFFWSSSLERQPRMLKGLGEDGTLVFEDAVPRFR